MIQPEIWKSAIAASIVAVVAALFSFWAYAVAFGQDSVETAGAVAGHLSFFAVLFGWPLALAICFVLGVLLRRLTRETTRDRARLKYLLGFTMTGAIVIPLLWMWLWASSNGSLPWIPLGAFVGAMAGGTFWYLLRFPDAT